MIFGRLKKALKEQNWFAVLLEILIVVLGVVIGFQISTWGETRANREKEQSYLVQISEDLNRTIRIIELESERMTASERAAELLFDHFWQAESLSKDSVLVLLSTVTVLNNSGPILGTVEALVNSGDLALIRDDKLRLLIPAFLEREKSLQGIRTEFTNLMMDSFNNLLNYSDMAEADVVMRSKGYELTVPRPAVKPIERAPNQRPPFPFDSESFFSNMIAYKVVYRIHHMKIQTAMMRNQMRDDAKAMLEMVEKSLDLPVSPKQ
ncbi:hypothetical protein HQ496_05700 [bacterium]|nr:hypothetical protein [bacterium]